MSTFFKAGLISMVFSAAAATPAFADPIFQSAVHASLTLTSVSLASGDGDIDIAVDGDVLVYDEDEYSDGAATSSLSASGSPAATDSLLSIPLLIDLDATGAVSGVGEAEAGAYADSYVSIENFSDTNTIELMFSLEYDLTADASVDDTAAQVAYAYTDFYAQYSGDFDPIVEYYLAADTDTSDTSLSASDIVTFSVFIGPQGYESISILADVFGYASSDVGPAVSNVPLPSMAGLFGLAAFLGLTRRRKQNR